MRVSLVARHSRTGYPPNVIHLFYGDAAADSFSCFNRASSRIVLREALLSGPAQLPSDAWNDVRSSFLSEAFDASREQCLANLVQFDEALEAIDAEEELVCWFGRDLFCQVGLMYTLVRLGALRLQKIALVCPDSTSEDVFCFGDVAPAEMNDMLQKREPVNHLLFQQAAISWHLYSSDDPQSLNGVLDGSIDVGERFAIALEQHASRFPWTSDHLGATERVILTSLRNEPLEFSELYRVVSKRTRHITWGDTQVHNLCKQLASCQPALLSIQQAGPSAGMHTFHLTNEGAKVLQGQGGPVARPHHWLGGCELSGYPMWLWDPSTRRIVYSGT